MAAQAVDQLVTQVVEIDGGVGNLSQGNDRVLVVIALDVSGAPAEMSRARWAASITSSKREGTRRTQSSTVMRAIRQVSVASGKGGLLKM